MPFMSGDETFRRLREISPDARVVLTTGFIHQHVLDRMLAEGLAGFIRKPVPPGELLGFVEKVLGGENIVGAASASRGIATAR